MNLTRPYLGISAASLLTLAIPVIAQPDPELNLQTYAEPGIPVTADYPDTMQVFGSASSEGVGIFFTFKPQDHPLDDAQVHVFLPAGVATAEDHLPFVIDPNGFIASNGWIGENIDDDISDQYPYDWVELAVNFSTETDQAGKVLLGQIHGQAVQVTLFYPVDMLAEYWQSAEPVLNSLQFEVE